MATSRTAVTASAAESVTRQKSHPTSTSRKSRVLCDPAIEVGAPRTRFLEEARLYGRRFVGHGRRAEQSRCQIIDVQQIARFVCASARTQPAPYRASARRRGVSVLLLKIASHERPGAPRRFESLRARQLGDFGRRAPGFGGHRVRRHHRRDSMPASSSPLGGYLQSDTVRRLGTARAREVAARPSGALKTSRRLPAPGRRC